MHGVSTIAIPKIGCRLDWMNWQNLFKLLRKVFAYSELQIVVYLLDQHAAHAMVAEGGPEFYAQDEIDRYSEEFNLNKRELETVFTSDAKSSQPDWDEEFSVLRQKEQGESLIQHYLQHQPKELVEYIKQFDFQYSDKKDNEITLLMDMLINSKVVFSLHKLNVGKTRSKLQVTLKPNVEFKRQKASEVSLHLKDKLKKLVTQLKEADIIREVGDVDEMGSLFANPIILMPKIGCGKLVIDGHYFNSVIDLTNFSWPLEPVQMIKTRVNGKFTS